MAVLALPVRTATAWSSRTSDVRVALVRNGEVHNIVIAESVLVAAALLPAWTVEDGERRAIAQNLPGAAVDARATDVMTAARGQWALEVVGTSTNAIDTVNHGGATRFQRTTRGGRSCLYYRVDRTDPDTASAKRIECSSPGAFGLIHRNQAFVATFSTEFDASGTTDDQLVFQVHTTGTYPQNPILALVVRGAAWSWVLRHNADAEPQQAGNTAVDLWSGAAVGMIDWRVEAMWNAAGGGYCRIWKGSQQVVSYTGAFGFMGRGAYFKAGIYHWLNDNAWDAARPSREAWHVGPRIDVLAA